MSDLKLKLASVVAVVSVVIGATLPQQDSAQTGKINTITVGVVAENAGITANNGCLQMATLILSGRYREVTEEMDRKFGACSREVVKAWTQKDF